MRDRKGIQTERETEGRTERQSKRGSDIEAHIYKAETESER